MAVRYNSAGTTDALKSTVGLLATSNVTMAVRFRMRTSTGATCVLVASIDNVGNGLDLLINSTPAIRWHSDTGGTDCLSSTIVADVWYFACGVCVGTNDATLYYAKEGDTALSVVTSSSWTLNPSPTQEWWGNDFAPTPYKGDLEHGRLWDVALTAEEVNAYWSSGYVDPRPDRLNTYLPMWSPGTAHEDYGPSGRLWVPQTTGIVTSADASNVDRRMPRRKDRYVLRTVAATASDVAISPTLTVDMAGGSLAAATMAISPTLTVGMVGKSLAAATVAISPTITFDAVGKSLAASTFAISPTLTVLMSAPGSASDVAISPSITVGLVGKSNALSTLAMSPALTVGMEGGATGSRVYPLSDHSSGRYFVNTLGEPTAMLEDMNQVVTGHLDQDSISTYLAALRTGGWNTIRYFCFTATGGTFSVVHEPNDYYNNVPFSTPNDFSTFSTSSAYALNLVKFWAKCNALEIMVNAFTTYLGFDGSPANQGWHEHITDVANTNTVMFNLGAALATLAQPYPNVNLWLEGDFTSDTTILTRMQNLVDGWHSVLTDRLTGSEPGPPNNVPTAVQTGFTYTTNRATARSQHVQSYYAAGTGANGQGYVEFDSAYDSVVATLPTYPTDTPSYNNVWSGGVLSSRKDTRRIRLQVLACGGLRAGHFFADDDRIFTATPSGILATMSDVATADGALANTLIRSLPHWLFRPSGSGTDHAGRTLIGTGIGTGNQKIQASMTSDGAYLLVYVPRTDTTSAVTFEVDLRGMNGNSRARWWNPTTGVYSTNASAAGTYTLANSASAQSFTTPGDNGTSSGDWMLLLDTTGSPAAVAISPTLTVGMAGTSQAGSTVAISPSITVGMTGLQAAAGAVAISPAITMDMGGKSLAASLLTMSPILNVAMESQPGALGGSTVLWRPQYGIGNQIWRPPYLPPYS